MWSPRCTLTVSWSPLTPSHMCTIQLHTYLILCVDNFWSVEIYLESAQLLQDASSLLPRRLQPVCEESGESMRVKSCQNNPKKILHRKKQKNENLNNDVASLQATLWCRSVKAKNLKRLFLVLVVMLKNILVNWFQPCPPSAPSPHHDHLSGEIPRTWIALLNSIMDPSNFIKIGKIPKL